MLHDDLKMFSEVKIQAKLSDCGKTCIFVRYTEHYSKDMYRILNLTTNSIIRYHMSPKISMSTCKVIK
jgi:hypothetical protein